jgi:hypothetical protein
MRDNGEATGRAVADSERADSLITGEGRVADKRGPLARRRVVARERERARLMGGVGSSARRGEWGTRGGPHGPCAARGRGRGGGGGTWAGIGPAGGGEKRNSLFFFFSYFQIYFTFSFSIIFFFL